ncbi:MAG: PorV/PorQ family protein [Candidatus Eisenbacteria bacterium]|nr:PorV/PorQ family protein [Candidatus Eisenbacteria bacterium]MCC7142467.1 PorV/PorQ family protein [Candidatus Eisenbacteria bacterium]
MFGVKRGTLPMAISVSAMVLLPTLGSATLSLAGENGGESSSNRNAPYLRAGAGARALGMGGAFVGVADDATAAYWNPAGLAWLNGWELTGMYTAGMNVDRGHNYVSIARNSYWGAYAAQWINAGTRDIEQRKEDGTYVGDFDFSDNALSLSLAKQFDVFSAGLTGKYLRQSIGANVNSDDAVNGFGLDLGAGLLLTDYARLGIAVQNVAGKLGSVDKVNDIPATLRAGIALMPMDGLTTAFDVEKTRDEDDYRFHAGAEYALMMNNTIGTAFRVGLNHDKFAGGVGLKVDFLRFDYAYVVEPQSFLDENHRFGVSLRFGEEERMMVRSSGDRDGDGISDSMDQCPDQPEDFDGFSDADGCPDPDNDGDGIADMNDDCPNQAEDMDGFQDSDGCPDPDNDGDGILDRNDKCPNQAETFNNFEDTDGCPDDGQSSNGYNCLPPVAYINFKFATAEISGADPIPVLEEVARYMKEHPEVRVKITGHTDNIGADASNEKLSMRRSEAIRDYLVRKGVSSDRFVLDGKGEAAPIDTNDTDLGRARNRRIEFTCLK